MVTVREPVLHTIPIAELRPTQITVGMREVHAKQKSWEEQDPDKKAEFLGRHMIPVIRGPKDRLYVIDHHHLSLALHNEGVEKLHVTPVADLRNLADDEFWTYLDNRSWVHPYDASGRRRDFDEIPKKISGLKDDPFRSVAGELRRIGGFAKDTTPFSEFLWADFMRRRISKSLAKDDFDKAMKQAMKLAKSEEASYLPGWCGPHVDHHVDHHA
ncbi:MAG TPA: ParB-like protein [Xanthobacteraceae bacterium]|nr:ParB-like protein [Xanthobacteraceae bacterium]